MGRRDLVLGPFRDVIHSGLGGPGFSGRVDADGLVADSHRAVLLEVPELATRFVAALNLRDVSADPGFTSIGRGPLTSIPVSWTSSWW